MHKVGVCYLQTRPGKESMLAAGAVGLPWHRCCQQWAQHRAACPFSLGLAAKVGKTAKSEARTERRVGCQTKH